MFDCVACYECFDSLSVMFQLWFVLVVGWLLFVFSLFCVCSGCVYFTLLHYCCVLIVVTVISNLDVVTIRIMICTGYLCSFGTVLLLLDLLVACLLFLLVAFDLLRWFGFGLLICFVWVFTCLLWICCLG